MSRAPSPIWQAGHYLACGATIATRWSAVRTQGFVDLSADAAFDSSERRLLDYSVQRWRLLHPLAHAYTFKATASWMTAQMAQIAPRLGPNEEEKGASAQLPDLAEVHSTPSAHARLSSRPPPVPSRPVGRATSHARHCQLPRPRGGVKRRCEVTVWTEGC